MKFNSVKTKLVLVLWLCLALAGGGVVMLLGRSYERNVERMSQDALKTSRDTFETAYASDEAKLSATLEGLMDNPEYKKAFLAGDRAKLLALTEPVFKGLKERYKITHWYWVRADTTCFLRVHTPAEFDDKIARKTMLMAKADEKPASGLEFGKKMQFTLRVVRPYYDAGKLIGFVELGEETNDFLTLLKKHTGSDYGLMIDKKTVKKETWEPARKNLGLPQGFDDGSKALMFASTAKDISGLTYDGDVTALPEQGIVLGRIERGGKSLVRTVVPVKGPSGDQVGALVGMHDVTAASIALASERNTAIGATAILIGVLSLIVWFLLDRLVFVRIRQITKVATRVVGGDFETEIAVNSNDEIGEFETLFERFRSLFVQAVKEADERRRDTA